MWSFFKACNLVKMNYSSSDLLFFAVNASTSEKEEHLLN